MLILPPLTSPHFIDSSRFDPTHQSLPAKLSAGPTANIEHDMTRPTPHSPASSTKKTTLDVKIEDKHRNPTPPSKMGIRDQIAELNGPICRCLHAKHPGCAGEGEFFLFFFFGERGAMSVLQLT
jgi:hypothetical protein